MTDEKIYSLCEVVADIAYIAGRAGYYSGDSRADISEFIRLAFKFEANFANQEWNELDYITEIENFCVENLNRDFFSKI